MPYGDLNALPAQDEQDQTGAEHWVSGEDAHEEGEADD
jgi:hypothetical protein